MATQVAGELVPAVFALPLLAGEIEVVFSHKRSDEERRADALDDLIYAAPGTLAQPSCSGYHHASDALAATLATWTQ